MNTDSVEVKHVACEICLKEVPITEAEIPEAADYFVHFCGLECYEQWNKQDRKPKEIAQHQAVEIPQ